MTIYETGAEERAYDRGFEHGEESGVEAGIDFEQARIIKLLEEVLASRIIKANGKPTSPTIGIQEAVALIKEEPK